MNALAVSLYQPKPSDVQALVRELAPDSQNLAIVKQTLGEDSLLVTQLNRALQVLSITAERQTVDVCTGIWIQTVQTVLDVAAYARQGNKQQQHMNLVALEASEHTALSVERKRQNKALIAEEQKAHEVFMSQAMTSLAMTNQATQTTVQGHIQMVQQHTEIAKRTLVKDTEEKRALEQQNKALEESIASL